MNCQATAYPKTKSFFPRLFSVLLLAFFAFFRAAGAQSDDAAATMPAKAGKDLEVIYQLQPFDLVQVSVYGEEDLATEQRISDKGQLALPLLGEIAVGGLTVSEAAKKIERAFVDNEYLRKPVVTISIQEFAPKTVTVLGQVEEPGSIEIPPGRNGIPLQVAVAGAGGFTGTAKTSEVRLTRTTAKQSDSEANFLVVNADDLLESVGKEGDPDPVMVFPDDIVYVPRRVF